MCAAFPTAIETSPRAERPRERLLHSGAESLSLRELLAVLLGTGPANVGCLGVAAAILARTPAATPQEEERSFFRSMEIAPLAHLADIHGVADAGRARLCAAFELGRRYARLTATSKARPHRAETPSLVRKALRKIDADLRSARVEWLGFVPVYQPGMLGDLSLVERGVRTHVNVDPRELFARILPLRPEALFLFHNHPSGDLSPSLADQELTVRVRELLDAFGIKLLGHFIVTTDGEILVC